MDAHNKLRIRARLAEKLRVISKRKRKQPIDLIHLILETYADEYTEKYLELTKED